MNPTILKLLMQTMLSSSPSLTPAQSNPALWGSPEEALEGSEVNEKKTSTSPVDRVKEAFLALKDMHKGPEQTEQAFLAASPDGPSPLDNAQWPFGPQGAPAQSQSFAQAPATPMLTPRPILSQDHAPAEAPMSFFGRNAALQRDPVTGDYIDPSAAQRADAGVFKGMFS